MFMLELRLAMRAAMPLEPRQLVRVFGSVYFGAAL
jgi:hypothetical protein